MLLTQSPDQRVIQLKKTNGESYFSKTYTTKLNIAVSSIAIERFVSEDDEYGNAPFDTIVCNNLDVVDLAIRLDYNPENLLIVKAGQTIGLNDQNIHNFTIENLSGSTEHTAGLLKVTLQNTKTPRKS